MTVSIKAKNIVVEFPIYDSSHQSLKKNILRAATGGMISADSGGHVKIRALDNVSFEFKEGDRVGIQGHNGAGKSTLLRVLSGCYEPTEGTLLTQGRIASLLDISVGFDGEWTGYENIFLRGLLMGLTPKQIRAKMEEIADFSELGEYMNMPLRTYSSGMVMRLAFSISTNVDADILLMDEWLGVGDASFMEKAEKRLNDIVNKTPILVLASHSKDLLQKVCSKQFRLNHGKLEEVSHSQDYVTHEAS
jgi:lipopolysaccharide transport system ATP-binding protein|uniref:ABC transporter ATP-binding protein n=1 Tax=Leptospirillum ferrodiazotrophum TaxID=412449 RepID=C6HY20_9BACT|nr:MAG: ABC transporter ATP-binding protein [Leptospirillum ferrodiazotrophum]